MSTKTAQCVRVVCDGCNVEFTAHDTDAFNARVQAAAAGWTFPRRLLASGAPSNTLHDDVCMDCGPTWSPTRRGDISTRHRADRDAARA